MTRRYPSSQCRKRERRPPPAGQDRVDEVEQLGRSGARLDERGNGAAVAVSQHVREARGDRRKISVVPNLVAHDDEPVAEAGDGIVDGGTDERRPRRHGGSNSRRFVAVGELGGGHDDHTQRCPRPACATRTIRAGSRNSPRFGESRDGIEQCQQLAVMVVHVVQRAHRQPPGACPPEPSARRAALLRRIPRVLVRTAGTATSGRRRPHCRPSRC